ncbi:MAG: hypothetical protein HDQ91_04005 [Desulfovibrio sp.]|nr:hypothetical protein [Desulfovibrio sp.]
MSQPVLIKVYASLWPATDALAAAVKTATLAALPAPPEIALSAGLLTLSFEGVFFPIDELAEAVEASAPPDLQGKIDLLDLENWELRRYLAASGKLGVHSAPLNNVLDYSGH